MPRTVIVLILSTAMLATAGFASTNSTTAEPGSGPVVRWTPVPSPAPAVRAPVAGNAGPTTIHWDKFYDASGNPLPGEPGDAVGTDSLYWKDYSSTTYLKSSAKVQDPSPADRTAMSFHNTASTTCMDPTGDYVYEVDGTSLYRFSTVNGAMTTYSLTYTGGLGCATDGQYIYRPSGTTMYKYTMTGTYVNSTTTDYSCDAYTISCCRDTVWFTNDRYNGVNLYGYACSKFTGGSINSDATWNVGTGTNGVGNVAWDGTYYYLPWIGLSNITFKRFYADRTLYSTGTVSIDPRAVMCKKVVRPLMIVSTDAEDYRAELAETLKVASGGVLNSIGTYDVGANATFPATDWYSAGCRVILEFSGSPYANDPILLGDSLAKFVDLGGRVVTAVWADAGASNLAGRYVSQYMPFTSLSNPDLAGSMGTVHDPLHPIMDGVTAISVTDYITGNTHSTLRSSNCICLAEWDSGNRAVAAYLDSADVRLASVGFVPFTVYSGATGQWAKLLANAILWVWPGIPAVTVTAPDTGNVWYVGTSHDITWTAANGPITRDSIVYSYDNGVTWNFLDKYTGSRTSYTWDPIPNTPDSNCYVRVFAWNAIGSAGGTSGKFEIQPAVGIAQPENNVLPLLFALYQSSPNPLASGAQVRYALPRPARVDLRIYDVSGALVRRLVGEAQTAGYRSAYWNGLDDRGRRVATGVYYCRFRAGDFLAAQKLVVRR